MLLLHEKKNYRWDWLENEMKFNTTTSRIDHLQVQQ